MRKSLIAAIAALAVLSVGGLAYAANVYTVDGQVRPAKGGTPKAPKPVSLGFDYSVRDENPAFRGTPVEKYFIAAEGLVTYPEAFPQCSGGSDGANQRSLADVKRTCRKAKVGGGVIKAYAGPSPDQTVKLNCVLELNLYNLKPGTYQLPSGRTKITKKHGGLAIRIDAVQDPPPNLDDEHKGRCAVAQNEAILAKYAPVRVNGITSDELQFVVPQSLLHPSGLDTVVQFVESSIGRRTAKKRVGGKRRTVGFYSAIGCKGGKRSIQVTFISEAGQRTPVTKNRAC